ncbi:hypothetical protein J437_LFUL014979 [Ladona fulva]|uniref:Uncharacterized protein n=1 Tax=Ladona fulva TaxID=123851 RepID=A0A8K0KKI1_LADFU|nr:hypothetical protein J437_LFUL014979 [Ladona fulva]
MYLFRELPTFVQVSGDGSLQSEIIRNPSFFPTQIFIFVYSSHYYFLLCLFRSSSKEVGGECSCASHFNPPVYPTFLTLSPTRARALWVGGRVFFFCVKSSVSFLASHHRRRTLEPGEMIHQDQIVEFCHRSGQVDVLRLDVELEYYQMLAVRDLIEAKQESKAEERPIAVHHSPLSQRCSLPKIKIPQFSGTFTDWEAFQNLFKSIVHDLEDISPTEKFSYLKTALSGDALALLSSVPFGAAYYPVA